MTAIAISAVLQMHREYVYVRKTVESLRQQTIRDQLELVLVVPAAMRKTIPEGAFAGLMNVQIVETPTALTPEAGWSLGIEKANGEIVVFCEDHSYPQPGWAAGFVEAHKLDCAVVGPTLSNANPKTIVSWASFLLTFIHWFGYTRITEVEFAAGHSSSYKRSLLLREYGDKLAEWLVSERALHDDIRARGYRILITPNAVTDHVNLAKWAVFLQHSFVGGRVYGGIRAGEWSLPQKLARALGAPLVPWVRLKRILNILDTPEKRRTAKAVRSLPVAMIGLHLHALGEAVGYVFGQGNALQIYLPMEMFRTDAVPAAERISVMGIE